MKKRTIYTNKDNEDFEISFENDATGKTFKIDILSGNNALYFTDKEEIYEFCRILTEEANVLFPPVKESFRDFQPSIINYEKET